MRALLSWSGLVLEVVILVGLVQRRRVRHCYALPWLVASWLCSDGLVVVLPAFNTWRFWIFKETLHALLAFALGIELSMRLLAAVPLGQLAIRRWCLAVLGFTVALGMTAPPGPPMITLLPRLLASLAWLYTGLGVVMARYYIPVARLHGAVLAALSPYCMLYWLTWSRAGSDTTLAGLVNPVAFLVVLVVLAWAAWQGTPDHPPAEPELLRLVQPWTR